MVNSEQAALRKLTYNEAAGQTLATMIEWEAIRGLSLSTTTHAGINWESASKNANEFVEYTSWASTKETRFSQVQGCN